MLCCPLPVAFACWHCVNEASTCQVKTDMVRTAAARAAKKQVCVCVRARKMLHRTGSRTNINVTTTAVLALSTRPYASVPRGRMTSGTRPRWLRSARLHSTGTAQPVRKLVWKFPRSRLGTSGAGTSLGALATRRWSRWT
jgi:hypothetical protein